MPSSRLEPTNGPMGATFTKKGTQVKFSMAWEAGPKRWQILVTPVPYTDLPGLIAEVTTNKVEGSQQIQSKNKWVCCHLLYGYGLDKILPGSKFDESKFQKRRNILAQ